MANARGILPLIVPFFLCLFLTISATAQDDRGIFVSSERLALVMGNNAYQTAPLRNPVNDAEDMGRVLSTLGFKVILQKNVDRRAMEDSIRSFGRQLRNGGVGLFYFAGHGMQVEGRNYLIPINARIESESDIKYEAVDAGLVLGKMEDAKNQLNIVILDACRNNPFSRNFRNTEQGLARMDAPKGALIAYSTAPGEVAADGPERNGVFTKHLIRHMQTPNLPVEQVLKRVRIDVAAETIQRQIPWESSSLMGDFFFVIDKKTETIEAVDSQPPSLTSTEVSSLVNKFDNKNDKNKPKINLAIFPMYVSASNKVNLPKKSFEEQTVKSINKVLIENNLVNPTFTYYDLKKEFLAKKIPPEIINDEIIEKMWQGGFFSTDKDPDINLFCKLGEKLQVDLIITCYLRLFEKDQVMKVFLVDVKKKKIFRATETDDFWANVGWSLQYYNVLPSRANSLISSVLEQFKSVMY